MRTKLEEFSQLRENEFWDVEQMSEEEIAQWHLKYWTKR